MNIMPETTKTGVGILPDEEKICIIYPDSEKTSSVIPEKVEDRSSNVNMKLVSALVAAVILLVAVLCVLKVVYTGQLSETLEENYWVSVDETTYSMYLLTFEDNTATMYYVSMYTTEEIGSVPYSVKSNDTIVMNGNTVTVNIGTDGENYTVMTTSPSLINTGTMQSWYAVPPDVLTSAN